MEKQLKNVISIWLVLLIALAFYSCKKNNIESDVFVQKQWKVDLSTSKEVPAISGRTDHAVGVIYLMDNGTLYYDVYFDTPIQNGDTPAHMAIYAGAAGQNGAVLIDLQNPAFNAQNESKGNITLSSTQQSLLTQSSYLSVASSQHTDGLVRGQVNN